MSDLKRSTGFKCPSCYALQGQTHTADCKADEQIEYDWFSVSPAGSWMFGSGDSPMLEPSVEGLPAVIAADAINPS